MKVKYHHFILNAPDLQKYSLPVTGNMDKTPVIFDMMPEKSLLEKGQKSVAIQTPGSEKRHVTVVLTVAADGSILPPMT